MGRRQPSLGVLGEDGGVVARKHGPVMLGRGATLMALMFLTTACSTGPEGTSAPLAPSRATESVDPLPRAKQAPRPINGTCYRLTYDEAVSPTNDARSRPCQKEHTAETYAVGTIDNVVDGHLLAVDSDRVQDAVAKTCPQQLSELVGGSEDDLRLSVLEAVWFTPTVQESDQGADWYRCDALALAADEELAVLDEPLDGVLTTPDGRTTYGMCGTAAPDSAAFERVVCSADHTWRAIEVVDLPDGAYPGEEAAEASGQAPCEAAGEAVADDPLDFKWGYVWPSEEQWDAGETFGRCWAPD